MSVQVVIPFFPLTVYSLWT